MGSVATGQEGSASDDRCVSRESRFPGHACGQGRGEIPRAYRSLGAGLCGTDASIHGDAEQYRRSCGARRKRQSSSIPCSLRSNWNGSKTSSPGLDTRPVPKMSLMSAYLILESTAVIALLAPRAGCRRPAYRRAWLGNRRRRGSRNGNGRTRSGWELGRTTRRQAVRWTSGTGWSP